MIMIFTTILNMSLTASYCIAAVILLRLLLRRQPKILSYLLWSVVLFRLLCPVAFSSSFSLLRMDASVLSQDELTDRRQTAKEAWQENDFLSEQNAGSQEAAAVVLPEAAPQQQESRTPLHTFLTAGAWVWFVGMILLITCGIREAYRLRRFLEAAVQVEEQVYETEGISSSFVFGIVRPRIYLPVGLSAEERKFVLEHERVHAARKDYLVKILAWLARCMHCLIRLHGLLLYC